MGVKTELISRGHCAVLSHSVGLFSTSCTVEPTRLLCPRGFSKQEYWSELPCPSPGDLPNPGIEPRSSTLQANSLPSEPPGKPRESPSPGDLPDPGILPGSPAMQTDSLPSEPPGKTKRIKFNCVLKCIAYNEDLINSALAKNSCEGVQDCPDSGLKGDRRSDWSEFMTGILPTGERDHPTSSGGAF